MEMSETGKWKVFLAAITIFCVLSGAWFFFFAAPDFGAAPTERLNIPLSVTEDAASIAKSLRERGLIKNAAGFRLFFVLRGGKVEPGGYELSKSLNAWQAAGIFLDKPALRWVVIPEGLRKEEIAEILSDTLDWSEAKKEKWLAIDTAPDADHTEGVYFPDTYLIPVTETGEEVAKRMRRRFEEIFAPYAAEASRQNIKWTTLLKIASLIQREAAGSFDMPLISGILWNRLEKNMKLQVDATLQYARGDLGEGYWAPIGGSDRASIISPFNTYLNAGLPPNPIGNPGAAAIEAALYPETTECLYYLHDRAGDIHCAVTYAGHLVNIDEYLKEN